MNKKYNIAFIPESKSNDIIKYAKNFSQISDQYQLGDNSLPHVTLCQFEAEEKEIDNVWKRVCDSLPLHFIELKFKDFSYLTRNNIIFWISLMPDQRSVLYQMHRLVADVVGMPANEFYDPHMTLINTKDIGYQNKAKSVVKSYELISDAFVLSIGECDVVGQFTKLCYKCEMKNAV